MDCNVGRHQEEGRKAGQVMARLFSRGFEERTRQNSGALFFWRLTRWTTTSQQKFQNRKTKTVLVSRVSSLLTYDTSLLTFVYEIIPRIPEESYIEVDTFQSRGTSL